MLSEAPGKAGNMGSIFSSALLIEDEPNLTTTLQVALERLGIRSQVAHSLMEARQKLAADSSFDLVLLDRHLPDGDGIDLCDSLRQAGFTAAILILTGANELEDRVQGLNRGADDYLGKPFSWEELEARLRAIARRRVVYAPEAAAGGYLWEQDEKSLRILGPKGWVELTPLEFRLADKLIQSEGSIVSRDSLLKDVWGFTLLPKTRTVDHFLGRLRKHFETNPEEPQHFITVRGAGYRFKR